MITQLILLVRHGTLEEYERTIDEAYADSAKETVWMLRRAGKEACDEGERRQQ
jgi:hypothetical protein